MQRAAWIFLAAILLPCLGLAWLAVRSEQDQQVVLQHQQAIIDQGVTDALAQNVRSQMDAVLADFVGMTQRLLEAAPARNLATRFDGEARKGWPLAQVGFAVDLQGNIYAPTRSDGPPGQIFRRQNESFLSNREDATVYSNTQGQLEKALQNAATTMAPPAGQSATVTGGSVTPQAPAFASSDSAAASSAPPVTMTKSLAANDSLARAAGSGSAAGVLRSPQIEQQPQAMNAPGAAPPPSATDSSRLEIRASLHQVPATSTAAAVPDGGSLKKETDRLSLSATAQDVPDPAPAIQDEVPEGKTAARDDLLAPAPRMGTGAAMPAVAAPAPAQGQPAAVERQVAPQENSWASQAALSNVFPAQSRFRQLVGLSSSGSIARFVDDKLCLLVWYLSAHDSMIFGAQLNQGRLVEKLQASVKADLGHGGSGLSNDRHADYCLALLDDNGHPVALSQPSFKTDWKHPFVATEIGSSLPHWEAALYLIDPQQLSHSARVLHFTIGLIILLLIVAILTGGTLIGADVGRQMRLAQQKTDFVSNVSHELKTPLTSIRMFADMLAEGRVGEPDKQATYLRIISAESARLTRLINNVLDFARLERGAPGGERQLCDLVEAARDVVKTCEPHLESTGITLDLVVGAESLPLLGDRDSLSQIILNLISNAEKYGGGEITVRIRRQDVAEKSWGCVDVLDRGAGIPARQVEKIFAPFQRLDDSLASGVPGSGLGLTLARRMARAHGGDVTYRSRPDGGGCFSLSLPLAANKS